MSHLLAPFHRVAIPSLVSAGGYYGNLWILDFVLQMANNAGGINALDQSSAFEPIDCITSDVDQDQKREK